MLLPNLVLCLEETPGVLGSAGHGAGVQQPARYEGENSLFVHLTTQVLVGENVDGVLSEWGAGEALKGEGWARLAEHKRLNRGDG